MDINERPRRNLTIPRSTLIQGQLLFIHSDQATWITSDFLSMTLVPH